MNIDDVRLQMATALDAIPDVQVSAYVLASPTPPAIQIFPPGVMYDYSMGSTNEGLSEWTFMVQAFVALTTDIGSQKLLDRLCAPSGGASVKSILEADKTLQATVSTLHVIEQTPGRVVQPIQGSPLLTVEWRVVVYAKGA